MATRTITVHDRCTVEGCNRVLHSIHEGERGICSSCWYKRIPDDTKKSLNKLVASAFNGSTDEQRDAAVEEAIGKLCRDDGRCAKCGGIMVHERLKGYRCPTCD
jgi:hypothetical protein